jgi:hypothetical protein
MTKIRLRTGRCDASWKSSTARLVCAAIVVTLLTACTTTGPSARTGRVVMSQHNGWAIRITPSLSDRWRARVQVWPPEVRPETHGGISVNFTESASTENAIVQAATASARRYIDASRSAH